jgi:hypothetical protein
MADGSEMMIYVLYILLVVVLAVAGWYMGARYTMPYIGAGVGALIGVGAVYGIRSYNDRNSYSAFY